MYMYIFIYMYIIFHVSTNFAAAIALLAAEYQLAVMTSRVDMFVVKLNFVPFNV